MNAALAAHAAAQKPALQDLGASDAIVARRHAPILICAHNEPFKPCAVAVTCFEPGQKSPSCRHTLTGPQSAVRVIEYAIWWDGDIEHLYELEHIWVFLDAFGERVHVCASAHGGVFVMETYPLSEDGRVMLYCEPGKHAHAAALHDILKHKEHLTHQCSASETLRGVMINDMFAAALTFVTPYDQFLGRRFLRASRFFPDYQYDLQFDLKDLPFMTWPQMMAYVPDFLRAQCETLRTNYKGIKAIFLDSGDTLIDEGSQVFHDSNARLVLSATAIEGGDQLVAALKQKDFLVALVADGLQESFENVHMAMGFWDLFDARVVSEVSGTRKPDARMFEEAMMKLGLRRQDAGDILMLGNNLERDMAGANALGMRSVFLDWSPRYPKTAAHDRERPDYTIHKPLDLLPLLEALDQDAGGF